MSTTDIAIPRHVQKLLEAPHFEALRRTMPLPEAIQEIRYEIDRAENSARLMELKAVAKMQTDQAWAARELATKLEAHEAVTSHLDTLSRMALRASIAADVKLREAYEAILPQARQQKNATISATRRGLDLPKEGEVPSYLEVFNSKLHHTTAKAFADAERETPGILDDVTREIIAEGKRPTENAVYKRLKKETTVAKGNRILNEQNSPAGLLLTALSNLEFLARTDVSWSEIMATATPTQRERIGMHFASALEQMQQLAKEKDQ